MLYESVNSSKSTDTSTTLDLISSVGLEPGPQIIKLQNRQYLDATAKDIPQDLEWGDDVESIIRIQFPRRQWGVTCSRVTAVGSEFWMVANDSTFNPIVYTRPALVRGLGECVGGADSASLFFQSASRGISLRYASGYATTSPFSAAAVSKPPSIGHWSVITTYYVSLRPFVTLTRSSAQRTILDDPEGRRCRGGPITVIVRDGTCSECRALYDDKRRRTRWVCCHGFRQ